MTLDESRFSGESRASLDADALRIAGPASSRRSARRDEGRLRGDPSLPPAREALSLLRDAQLVHPFRQSRLLTACASGRLTRDELALVAGQIYLASRYFSRCLAALIAGTDRDDHRARLAAVLWEESGSSPHFGRAGALRRLLSTVLEVDPAAVEPLDSTCLFTRACLDFCRDQPPEVAVAFLDLGVETIAPRMHAALLDGLLQAGVPFADLEPLRVQLVGEGPRAVLDEVLTAHAHAGGWFEACARGMNHALDLGHRFLEMLHESLENRRVRRLVDRVRAEAARTGADELVLLARRPPA